MTLFIADVSDFQGAVDWDAYKASGRAGAIIKVSEGRTLMMDTFRRNREGIAGLVFRGLYHFGRQANDPSDDAENFCTLVGTLRPGELPILDAEHTKNQAGDDVIGPDANWCVGFAQDVTQRLGMKPALYFSEAYFSERLDSDRRLAQAFTFFWVAAFRRAPRPTIPGMKLWQSTDGVVGKVRDVPGIPATPSQPANRCDDNEFEGTIPELAALAGSHIAETFIPKEGDGMRLVGVANRGIFLVSASFEGASGKAIARHVDSPEQVVELLKTGVVSELNKDTLSDAIFDRYFVVV